MKLSNFFLEAHPREIHWSVPGAIHQTRWMARNLYSMKMLMSCDQLEYDEEAVAKLERLKIFLALFYTLMWMLSTFAADAPVNDLLFIQNMLRYKRLDEKVAETVPQKMENHIWYLTKRLCHSRSSAAGCLTSRSRTLLLSCMPLWSQTDSEEEILCFRRWDARLH